MPHIFYNRLPVVDQSRATPHTHSKIKWSDTFLGDFRPYAQLGHNGAIPAGARFTQNDSVQVEQICFFWRAARHQNLFAYR
jgi:hypothetical protein